MTATRRRHPARTLATAALVVFLVVGSFVASGGPAEAAPLTRQTLPVFSLSCSELLAPDAGVATLFADQQGAELFASSALWAPGGSIEIDSPLLVSAGFDLTREGNEIAGTLAMVDAETDDPAGQATFDAVLRPFGEPWVSDSSPERGHSNVVDRSYRTEQEATVEGVLRLPDGTERSLDSCTAAVGEIVVVRNTPQKVVEQLPPQTFASCVVPGDAGHELGLLVLSEHGFTFAELAVFPPGEDEAVVFGFGEVHLGRKTLTGTVPLITPEGEEAGTAVIAATVETLGPRIEKGTEGDVRYRLFAKDFVLRGEVAVTGFGTFPLDDCTGAHERGWLQYPNPGI